jgi:hypothetical protein
MAHREQPHADTLEHLEIGEDFARFRPLGRVSLQEAASLVSRAIAFCRERRIRRLLVDVSQLTGFEPPTIAERYWFVQEWAQEARATVVVAMVVQPRFIDPQRFGVIAAANAGLKGDVFTSESEAVSWLLRN